MSDITANMLQLSAILYCAGHFNLIRRAILHLRAQTICDRIEVVIVCKSLADLGADESLLQDFASYQLVEASQDNYDVGRTEGVLSATAPLVALREDHSFPDEQWAAATVEAHQQGYTAIGPLVFNANPKTLTSEAMYQIYYGYWARGEFDAPVKHLPGHNSAYDKAILLKEYGDELVQWIAAQPLIDPDLRTKGYKVTVSPKAHIYHTNTSRFWASLHNQYYVSLHFNATRNRTWSFLKRSAYLAATPIIPFYRMGLLLPHYAPSSGGKHNRLAVWSMMFVLLCSSALGEMVAHFLGKSPARAILDRELTNRTALLIASDQQAFVRDDLTLPFGVE